MKKTIITLLIVIVSFTSYAQIKFEKGYFINNTNEKITCLIKNIDWKNNPTQFKYKLSENEESNTGTINNIKEFGVDGYSKYVKYEVDIDKSSNLINKLSNNRNPEFKKETLFLKVLIEGGANLYLFEEGNLRRYFYRTKNTEIEQLIFKKFLNNDESVGKNEKYKQQLWTNLICDKISKKHVKNIGYTETDLTKFFLKYNSCNNKNYKGKNRTKKRNLFNVKVIVGITKSKLTINNNRLNTYIASNDIRIDFENKTGFKFGLEAEFILPFNKNIWSVIVAPTYQSYKAEKKITYIDIPSYTLKSNVKVDYKTIDIPVQIRYYYYLNSKSKIFVNAGYAFNLTLNSKISGDALADDEIESYGNIIFGIGYSQNKVSLEFQYALNRELIAYNYDGYGYKNVALVFGYTIF